MNKIIEEIEKGATFYIVGGEFPPGGPYKLSRDGIFTTEEPLGRPSFSFLLEAIIEGGYRIVIRKKIYENEYTGLRLFEGLDGDLEFEFGKGKPLCSCKLSRGDVVSLLENISEHYNGRPIPIHSHMEELKNGK